MRYIEDKDELRRRRAAAQRLRRTGGSDSIVSPTDNQGQRGARTGGRSIIVPSDNQRRPPRRGRVAGAATRRY